MDLKNKKVTFYAICYKQILSTWKSRKKFADFTALFYILKELKFNPETGKSKVPVSCEMQKNI